MSVSKKLWLLSIPYLVGVLCGLVALMAHPAVFKLIYTWRAPSAHVEDALRIGQALWEKTPFREVNQQLQSGHLETKEIQHFEDVRQVISHLPVFSLGFLAFALIVLLLDRRASWGQLHNRGFFLLLFLAATIAAVGWYHWDWLFYCLHAPFFKADSWLLDPCAYSLELYPEPLWQALFVIYFVLVGLVFLLPFVLGARKADKASA